MSCNHCKSEAKHYCVICDPLDVWLPLYDRIVRADERETVLEIINKRSGHYGITHYEGMNCQMCRVFRIVRGEEE
jgi:hypothetical protein